MDRDDRRAGLSGAHAWGGGEGALRFRLTSPVGWTAGRPAGGAALRTAAHHARTHTVHTHTPRERAPGIKSLSRASRLTVTLRAGRGNRTVTVTNVPLVLARCPPIPQCDIFDSFAYRNFHTTVTA